MNNVNYCFSSDTKESKKPRSLKNASHALATEIYSGLLNALNSIWLLSAEFVMNDSKLMSLEALFLTIERQKIRQVAQAENQMCNVQRKIKETNFLPKGPLSSKSTLISSTVGISSAYFNIFNDSTKI